MEYKWAVNKIQVTEDNLVAKVDLTVTGTDSDSSAFGDNLNLKEINYGL